MATAKAKPQRTVLTFGPKRMKYDKNNPKIIYDSTRKLSESAATTKGYIYVGIKDKPSALDIKNTIMHETCHTGHKVAKTYLQAARQELQAYEREKAKLSPQNWNRVLPVRINDFLPSISYLTKGEQRIIKSEAKSVLSPQVDGGNEEQIELALRKLGKFWIEEESTKPMQIVYHGTNEAVAKKILKNGFKRGTFFATHLEHSLGYGGNYIFEVAVPSAAIPKTPDWEFEGTPTIPKSQRDTQSWEFTSDGLIPPSQIVELKQYPTAKTITKNEPLRTEVFNPKTSKHRYLQVVYHGTDEATAKKIQKNGFKPGTFFALHLEDSVGFGGNYIFEVAVESATLPKPDKTLGTDWEFIATDRVPPSQIVELKHYPKAKSITENKALGEAVFRSNLPKPKPQPDIQVVSTKASLHTSRLNIQPQRSLTGEIRGKIVKGVGYADKGNRRLSRERRRGWRKVKFT